MDEEANGFIQSFLLQPRQHANPPPGSRLICLYANTFWNVECKRGFCAGKVLVKFQHKQMKQ